MSINILKYESDVWRTADLLIGAGIKQSDFPKYMMPYFALLMVESRLLREAQRLEEEIGKGNIDDFIEMFQLEGLGYIQPTVGEPTARRGGKAVKFYHVTPPGLEALRQTKRVQDGLWSGLQDLVFNR